MRRVGVLMLREEPLPHVDYVGFVEGDDIGSGKVDVVVTEGFAGNIALKMAEGTAHQFADYLKFAISQSIWSKLGYLLARPAFRMTLWWWLTATSACRGIICLIWWARWSVSAVW